MNCCYYWLMGGKSSEEKQDDELKKDLLNNEVQSEYIQRSGSDDSNSVGTQTPHYLSDVQSDSEVQSEGEMQSENGEVQSENGEVQSENGEVQSDDMQEDRDDISETSTLEDDTEEYIFERISSDEAQERIANSVNSSAETEIRFVLSN